MPRRITDPYQVLGLDSSATETDVKAAFLCLAPGVPEIGQHRSSYLWYFPVASRTGVLADRRNAKVFCLQTAPTKSETESF